MTEKTQKVHLPELSKGEKTTTHVREWWGWFGTINWLIFMMYGLLLLNLPEMQEGKIRVTDFNVYFMIIFSASIIIFSLCFGKKIESLSKIGLYTTPFVIIITIIFPLFSSVIGIILYLISPILMAPTLVRRVYGVIYTAPTGKQLTSYMSAIGISYICYSTWLTLELSKEIAFIFPALMVIPAVLGICRNIKLQEKGAKSRFKISWKLRLFFIIIIALLVWIATMNAIIFTNILSIGIKTSDHIISLFSYGIPGISYLLYAVISDKGHERTGLTISMMLFIFGIFVGLLSGMNQGLWLILLTIAITLGGSYFEFLFLSIPIYFLPRTKRPLFVSSLGVVVELIFAVALWKTGFWVPKMFWFFGKPLLFSAGFSAVVFVILISFLFERYKEKSLAAVLYNFIYEKENNKLENNKIEQGERSSERQVEERKSLAILELSQEETEVALLLVDGKSRSEITRKLRLKSSDATNIINSIKYKMSGENVDPIISTVTKKYNLTKRESDMLQYLQKEMTNQQIAYELFISESTVKNHVHNLINKLPVKTRQEVHLWLESINIESK